MDENDTGKKRTIWEHKFMQPLKSRKEIILNNFLGGLSWSLGTFVGLGIIATILGYIFRRADLAEAVSKWIAQIIQESIRQLPPTR